MSPLRMILFFGVFFGVYGGGAFYTHRRLALALPEGGWRLLFSLGFLLATLAYPLGRFLERAIRCTAADALIGVGALWMAALLYLFLGVLAWDLLRLATHVPAVAARLSPAALTQAWGAWAGPGLLGLVLLVLAAGWTNASTPRLNVMSLDLDARAPKAAAPELRVALATDIHLGHLAGEPHLRHLLALLKDFKPDLVILGGDVVDEDLAPVIEQDLGDLLRQIQAPLGVWAVTGNHEYIGGASAAVAYLEQHGIRFLRDAAVTLPNGVVLIGREDRSSTWFGGHPRKAAAELAQGLPEAAPKILIDHQPPAAREFRDLGCDLVLSGHTHHGQLWPVNFITARVFEHSHGLQRVGRAWQYVSPGFGTWGPPVRTTARPELTGFVLRFKR